MKALIRTIRPTRWTRKRRLTKFGKGGWHFDIRSRMWSYTNPVTGDGVAADGLRRALRMRQRQESHQHRTRRALGEFDV